MVCKVSGEVGKPRLPCSLMVDVTPTGLKRLKQRFSTQMPPLRGSRWKGVRFYKHIVPTGLRSEGWCVRYPARLGNLAYRVR